MVSCSVKTFISSVASSTPRQGQGAAVLSGSGNGPTPTFLTNIIPNICGRISRGNCDRSHNIRLPHHVPLFAPVELDRSRWPHYHQGFGCYKRRNGNRIPPSSPAGNISRLLKVYFQPAPVFKLLYYRSHHQFCAIRSGLCCPRGGGPNAGKLVVVPDKLAEELPLAIVPEVTTFPPEVSEFIIVLTGRILNRNILWYFQW